jgi:hypothetical protein
MSTRLAGLALLALGTLALAPAAALASPTAPRAAPASAPSLPVLIFTTRGWNGTDFLQATLHAFSIDYTLVSFDPNDRAGRPFAGNLSQLLWNDGGNGSRWAGLISYPNVEAMGYLNRSEVETLWRWQAQTRVRSVKFGAWGEHPAAPPPSGAT